MDVQKRRFPLLDRRQFAIGTKTLVITGGEPFIHPDLFLAIREAKSRGMNVNVTTTGHSSIKRWDELCQSGVDSVSFSIDGLEGSHDAIRGQKGAWKRTLDGLDRVRRETSRDGDKHLQCGDQPKCT